MEKKNKKNLILILVILIGIIFFGWFLLKGKIEPQISNPTAEQFGEAIKNNKYDEALIICNTKTPFGGGGDPPLLFTRAFCYCYVAKEISKTDITKAVETCNEIDNFSDDLTSCSSKESCLGFIQP